NKSAATFNGEKLLWLNSHYIRQADPKRLADLLVPILKKQTLVAEDAVLDSEWLERLVTVLRDRSRTLLEMAEKAAPFLGAVVSIEPGAQQFLTSQIQPALPLLYFITEQASFDHADLDEDLKQFSRTRD